MTPTTKFDILPPEKDLWLVNMFLSKGGTMFRRHILEMHPRLATDDRKDYVHEMHEKLRPAVEQKTAELASAWSAVEQDFYQTLSGILQTEWPDREIGGYVSTVCPMNPRHIQTWTFSVYHGNPLEEMLGTAGHEIIHFLYFQKWKEVFPDSDESTFEMPHPVWHLSEILAPVIQNDPRVRESLGGIRGNAWRSYWEMKVDGESVAERYIRMYRDMRKGDRDFGRFLERGYEELEKYEGLL